MKTNETREQDITPKTVQVKLLIPWAIVGFLITAAAFTILGWMTHINQQSQVTAEASSIVSTLSKTGK